MEYAIKVQGLNKIFQLKSSQQVHALKDLNLEIPKGKIFGLLGHNGAGKSTLINILAQIIDKTSGKVWIDNENLDNNKRLCAYKIGVVPQEIYEDFFQTPLTHLTFLSRLYGLGKQKAYIESLLKTLQLFDKRNAQSTTLSGGMKRRLLIAKAMVSRPKILVLDEPTAGVDVQLRLELWDLIRSLNKHGISIILTTHYLEEAEKLCDNIAIIQMGKILLNETKATLKDKYGYTKVELKLHTAISHIPNTMLNIGSKVYLSTDGKVLNMVYHKENLWQKLSPLLSDLPLQDVVVQSSSLEDIYLNIVNHKE